MSDPRHDIEREYAAALRGHLEHQDETALEAAYAIGRSALAAGLGILDIAAIHHQVARALLAGPAGRRDPIGALVAAEAFFLESLTPFEMTHRAFREANVALRRLGDRLEEEAKRIAHALHDEAGWLLASVHIALDEVERELPQEKVGSFRKIKLLLDEIESQLRRLSHELRPTILDDLGLVPALDFLSKGVAQRAGIPMAVEGTTGGRLPAAVETTVYRVVQEALSNVARHARASQVTIHVEREPKRLRCGVRDDGVGFDPVAASAGRGHGLGLISIRERLDAVHGVLHIVSAPGRGTELLLEIPLEG